MGTLLPILRPVLFGAVFAAPVALFAVFLGKGTDAAPVSVSPAAVAAKPISGKQQESQPVESLDAIVTEILERPLFSPSRQGVDKSSSNDVAQEPPPPPPPQLPQRLAGMSIRPEGRQALFENQGEKPIAVNEGQQIAGWTVASIQPDRVVLRSAAGEQIMKPANSTRPTPVLSAQNRKPAPPAGKKPAKAGGAKPQTVPAVAQQAQRPGQTNRPVR